MAKIGLWLDPRLQSGSCTVIPRRVGRVSSRPATAERAGRGPKDYCLLDEQGERLGTIVATGVRPMLGKNASTIYLRRRSDIPRHPARPFRSMTA